MPEPSIFIGYSHKDKGYKDRLVTFLNIYELKGLFKTWDDGHIRPGEKWRAEISEAIQKAKVAVLLITADFLASDFIQDTELPEVKRRHESERLVVLPVICKPCPWKQIKWLEELQVLPLAFGIDSLSDSPEENERERLYQNISEEIHRLFSEYDLDEETPQESEEPPQPTGLLMRDGFYTAAGVIDLIKRSSKINAGEKIVGTPLLIFRTKRQRTWLVTTDEALYCVLDGEKTQAKGRLIQWRQPLSEIHTVQAKPRPQKKYTGAVDLGRRHNWLYSKKLFLKPEDPEEAILKMLKAARQA